MDDRRDIVDIKGLREAEPSARKMGPPRPFLSIWYRCCHSYGRLYRNKAESAYEGRCPRCGAKAQVGIDANGTTNRLFEAN